MIISLYADSISEGIAKYAGIVRINEFGVPAYRSGDRCGFCGGSGWHVGRITAECSNPRCGNAVMRDHP